MEKINLVGQVDKIGRNEANDEAGAVRTAWEIRTLEELELMVASGGDGVSSWG